MYVYNRLFIYVERREGLINTIYVRSYLKSLWVNYVLITLFFSYLCVAGVCWGGCWREREREGESDNTSVSSPSTILERFTKIIK